MNPRHTALLERLRHAGEATPAGEPGRPAAGDVEAPAARTSRARTLRVDVATLDRILDLTGEIAVARGRVAQALEAGVDALEAHREADRLQVDLQELVLKVRMVPLRPTLARMTRVLRDTAAALGRQARIRLAGDEVEVDTKLAELIADPLTHLVRNAVAHGIEPPETRAAAGKDPCGTVTLSATREMGSIVITVADDGAGLDHARIRDAARRRGVAGAEGDVDAERLIFEPGVSTAGAVSVVAGRGGGLDVVRRNVVVLRGALDVSSLPGRSTTFTIRLPLTLAIISAFAVGVEDETFLVPLDSVVACVDLPEGGDRERDTGVLALRGQALPFVRLRRRMGLGGGGAGRERVVIVQHRGRQVGLVADRLLGDRQAVIKPLGRLFRGLPGVAGGSVLGDGRVALLIEVGAVIEETC
jgi:two-component system chemotaxis sensor kinase CheA